MNNKYTAVEENTNRELPIAKINFADSKTMSAYFARLRRHYGEKVILATGEKVILATKKEKTLKTA